MAFTDRTIVNQIAYTEGGEAIYPAGPVYSASAVGIVGATGATDTFTITGSASKNVRIHNIVVTGTQASSAVRDILLIKRSTANTGGTSTTPTVISLDSNSAAGTAVVRAYTVNPTLGTTVGTVRVRRIGVPTTAAVSLDMAEFQFTVPLTLRGTAQVLSVNFNNPGVAITFSAYVEWSED
jgi:hypothetical protein